jgi:hypothetical protein
MCVCVCVCVCVCFVSMAMSCLGYLSSMPQKKRSVFISIHKAKGAKLVLVLGFTQNYKIEYHFWVYIYRLRH